MRANQWPIVAAGMLWAAGAMAQDVPSLKERSAAELYEALYYSTAGLHCYPVGDYSAQNTDALLHQRFQKVRPWLVAQIGQAELDAMVQRFDEEMGTVYFVGCPSDLYEKRQTRRRREVLREMERRARAAR